MAEDEQFSLCWNNFNSNLSAGFHESLCRGDLVDVTLAAEGQLVKAHRLVLSVCSPYFRKMFTQMPANQHAFVFLKDVSHTALKDLIQFMYCGEVNVKQEALPAFISTAEALQIKGLTDSDPPPAPAEPTPPPPPPTQIQINSPRIRQRTSSSRAYKIETLEDSGDDNKQPTQIVIQTTTAPSHTTTIAQQQPQQQQQQHHHHLQQSQQQHAPQQIATSNAVTTTTVVTHKRPAQRSIAVPHIKRTKSTIDPLEPTEPAHTQQQITVQTAVVAETKSQQQQQQQSEPEYIDLPIELPTKSEPDYTEEAGDVESADAEATYVEDDSYGELRYDESYFTENDDAANVTAAVASAGGGGNVSASSTATTSKAIVKQQNTTFSDPSYVDAADQTNNDAQADTAVIQLVELYPMPVARKRGRPKGLNSPMAPTQKLWDRMVTAVQNNPSQPAVYASTTKGGMKLLYDGHHFRYSFRKGPYSIFQCCYKENKEECKVRVVSDQKRVYPFDGEHVHFVQATDKSVTAVCIEAGELNEEQVIASAIQQLNDDEENDMTPEMIEPKVETPTAAIESVDLADDVTESNIAADTSATDLANDFREKIKKRLQKALLGKKK